MSYCLNPNCQKPQNPGGTRFCQHCGSLLLLKDRYRTVRPIGQGGFGRTFLAVDEYKPSKPCCVIKQFFPQAGGTNNVQKAAELFEQEAVRLDELGKHPQVPELLAYFTQEQRQYLVQEFIDGQNLAEELAIGGAFNETQLRELLSDLLSVLQFVHSSHVIHRDIKPENIIRRSSDGQLVLVDFGAAKFATGTALERTGTLIGSAGYAAPEQTGGKAVFSSDLYSLGITGLHLLTQVEPFDLYSFGEDSWVWRDYLTQPVSEQLSRILDKLIEKAIKRRYQSADEVLKDLNPQQIPSPKPTPLPPLAIPVLTHQTQGGRVDTLKGHCSGVFSIAISPQGNTLVSGSGDNTIKIWHLGRGELLGTLTGHLDLVRSVVISPDGQTLFSGSDDKSIKIWHLGTRKLLRSLTGHSASVCSVAISPDGQILASGSRDKTIKVWHLDTGQRLHSSMGHSNCVNPIVIGPDGQTLASGSSDTTIKIWHLHLGQLLHVLKGHSDSVYSVAISPDGQTLASSGYDKTIKIWDLHKGKLRYTLEKHSGSVYTVAISPNGQILASGSGDKTIKLWNLNTGELLKTLIGHLDAVYSVTFSPDCQTLVSGSADKTIKIWHLDIK